MAIRLTKWGNTTMAIRLEITGESIQSVAEYLREAAALLNDVAALNAPAYPNPQGATLVDAITDPPVKRLGRPPKGAVSEPEVVEATTVTAPTTDDVRTKLLSLLKLGDDVPTKLLKEYEVLRIKDLKPEQYAPVIARADEILKAGAI
jgi:hypothetical protein